MSYRIRFTLPDGRTGLWAHDYPTREEAQRAIDDRLGDTGFAYAVEEVQDAPQEPKPEPTSTTERIVGLLRDRHARGLAKYGTTLDRTDLTPEQWAQHAIEEAVDLAGYLMRLKDVFGQEPGSTAAHHVEILRERVKELEALGEGGDSDRRRLEALERYLEGDTFREVWKTSMGPFAAGTKIEGQHFDAPTLAALADKLAAEEAKP